MKRVLFIVSFVLVVQSVLVAQETGTTESATAKGKIFISPNIGYNHPFDLADGVTVLDLSLNADEGYFICENFAITTTLGIHNCTTEISSSSYSTKELYTYYTYNSKGGKVSHTGTRTVTVPGSSSSSSSIIYTYGAGLRYYIIDKVFIGTSLVSSKIKGIDATSSVHLQAGYSYFLKNNFALETSVSYIKGIGDADGFNSIQGKLGVGFYF